MILLDASVLIAQFSAADIHHRRAQRILLASGTQPLFVSCITLAKVLVTPTKSGRLAEIVEDIGALGIKELPLPLDSAKLLAKVRASTALKLPDCCVILMAQQANAAIATFDEKLAIAAEECGIPIFRG
ncbi:MAG: type II toxin-antitoxin system VapC family toxin [Angustibacter sp.]